MTVDKLQSLVLLLANVESTRYWLHWNYPARAPWLMAVAIRGERGKRPRECLRHDMTSQGFAWDPTNEVWTIERTDDDGKPFGSDL